MDILAFGIIVFLRPLISLIMQMGDIGIIVILPIYFSMSYFVKITQKPKLSIIVFILIELAILLSVWGMFSSLDLLKNVTKTSDVIKLPVNINYFEIAALSLTITAFMFGSLKKRNKDKGSKRNIKKIPYPNRICLLTLISSLIFFLLGFIIFLNEITYKTNLIYVEVSGIFLGFYNIISSIIFLFEYFIKEWGA